jgi:hypothetical protein
MSGGSVGRQVDPVGRQVDPVGRQVDPVGRQVDHVGRQVDPVGRPRCCMAPSTVDSSCRGDSYEPKKSKGIRSLDFPLFKLFLDGVGADIQISPPPPRNLKRGGKGKHADMKSVLESHLFGIINYLSAYTIHYILNLYFESHDG